MDERHLFAPTNDAKRLLQPDPIVPLAISADRAWSGSAPDLVHRLAHALQLNVDDLLLFAKEGEPIVIGAWQRRRAQARMLYHPQIVRS